MTPIRAARLLLAAAVMAGTVNLEAGFRALWPDSAGHDDHGRGDGGGKKWPEGLKKIGGQKGSNPGGLHEDASGQKWYVKQYKDPTQAASEQVANDVYKAVGVAAPESVLGEGGQYASKWEEGTVLAKHGLDKETADKVLDGFAADVLLDNWDAVGTGHDNILVRKGGVSRIDQGGTLLHRAQGAPKPEGGLHKIGEWESLATVNPYYEKVFQAAGVKDADALGGRAVAQIERISAARPKGGWKELVDRSAPRAPAAWRAKAAAMLESRTALLEKKAASLKSRHLDGFRTLWPDAVGFDDHGRGPASFQEEFLAGDPAKFPLEHASRENIHAFIKERTGIDQEAHIASMTKVQEKALNSYRGQDFYQLTGALREGRDLNKSQVERVRQLDKTFTPLGKETTLVRGVRSDDLASLEPGDTVASRSYQSTSLTARESASFANPEHIGGYKGVKPGAPVRMNIKAPAGTGVALPYAAGLKADIRTGVYPHARLLRSGYDEVVLPRNTSLRITGKRTVGRVTHLDAEVVPFHPSHRFLAEFDESKHPRDDKGKFSESEGGIAVKQKAAPATKDQVAKAVEMKKAGASYAAIQAETGLNPKQAATIVFKANKKEKELAAALGAKGADPLASGPGKATAADVAKAGGGAYPEMSMTGGEIPSGSIVQYGKVYDKSGTQIGVVKAPATAPPPAAAPQAATSPLGAGKAGWAPETIMTASGDIHNAKGEKLAWKEKTTGAKENVGKYAYFNEAGTQVSVPAPKSDFLKAAATINQGKGPDWAAPVSAAKPDPWAPAATGIHVEKGAGKAGDWPISDSTPRTMGTATPAALEKSGAEWAGKLTAGERGSVKNYTGSSYSEINQKLRSGGSPHEGTAGRITSALAKSPDPPPPDLVWRGISHTGVHSVASGLGAGDVIELKGFQSTSISPGFANGWGGGKTLFEIRPSKGAYVRPISSHKSEYEYLLPHGAKYTVAGVKTVKLGSSSHKVIQLEMHK